MSFCWYISSPTTQELMFQPQLNISCDKTFLRFALGQAIVSRPAGWIGLYYFQLSINLHDVCKHT